MSVEGLHITLEARFDAFSLSLSETLALEGVTAIFGRSGAGKSSLLRLIAGLERPVSGLIRAHGETWCDTAERLFVPPHKRRVAYVFQGGQLLPHLSVAENLQYADKRAQANQPGFTLGNIVEAFDLSALMAQRPDTLSGGERQRAALGQALLARPELLLLDEPLAALDRQRKRDILPYLQQLQSRFAMPMLYVSHDIGEVTRIADRVLMLKDGAAVDHGPATDVLNRHGFGGDGPGRDGVILVGTVRNIDTRLGLTELAIGDNTLRLALDEPAPVGTEVPVIINASDVVLSLHAPDGLSIQNALRGTVARVHPDETGAMADVEVMLGERALPARVTRAAVEALDLRAGLEVYALVKTAVLAR